MHSVERRREEILLGLFRIALYTLIPSAFFLMLAVTNPQILRISRTSAITLSSFALIDTIMVGALGSMALAAVGMAGQWS